MSGGTIITWTILIVAGILAARYVVIKVTEAFARAARSVRPAMFRASFAAQCVTVAALLAGHKPALAVLAAVALVGLSAGPGRVR